MIPSSIFYAANTYNLEQFDEYFFICLESKDLKS